VIVASPRRAGYGNPPTSAATENGESPSEGRQQGGTRVGRGGDADRASDPARWLAGSWARVGHGRCRDLGVLDALQGDRGGAEVGVAQLTFGDVEGDAFVGQLDGVTRRSGCGARPRPSRATTCRWCRTADRPSSPYERDPGAAGARSSGRRCRPRGACRACRGGSRNGGRSRRSPRRSLVRSPLQDGLAKVHASRRPPILGW
jgi:hypothetical protein